MDKKKEVTIYDIAKELNVSPSTVSRALRDHHSIGEKTKNAIKKVAAKRDYRPNGIAASLRGKRVNAIGVVVSSINRPFVSSLISGIEMEANAKGYNVMISQSHDIYKKEIANAQALFDSRVKGLIVSLAMESQGYKHFRQFINNNIPVVLVDRVEEGLNCDMVVINNFEAGYTATQHLIDQGCKRIAHIGGAEKRNVYKDRRAGYIQALKDHNLPVDENLMIESKVLSAEEGTKSAEYLLGLPIPPDGIFTANDTTAVSIIQYAKKEGIKIPEELAIIGFNNDPVSLIVEPSLSTVSHPAVEMGRLAAQQILRKKDNNLKEISCTNTVVLQTNIVVRNSSNKTKVSFESKSKVSQQK